MRRSDSSARQGVSSCKRASDARGSTAGTRALLVFAVGALLLRAGTASETGVCVKAIGDTLSGGHTCAIVVRQDLSPLRIMIVRMKPHRDFSSQGYCTRVPGSLRPWFDIRRAHELLRAFELMLHVVLAITCYGRHQNQPGMVVGNDASCEVAESMRATAVAHARNDPSTATGACSEQCKGPRNTLQAAAPELYPEVSRWMWILAGRTTGVSSAGVAAPTGSSGTETHRLAASEATVVSDLAMDLHLR